VKNRVKLTEITKVNDSMVFDQRVKSGLYCRQRRLVAGLMTLALICVSIAGVFVPGHIAVASESGSAYVEEDLRPIRSVRANMPSIDSIRAPKIKMEIPDIAIDSMIWPVAGSWNNSCGFLCGCWTHGGGHRGKDIGTFAGTPPVIAVAPGRVIDVVWGYNNGNGNVVEIDHGHGIVSRYAHLSEIAVSIGQLVDEGEQIGNAGSTGASAGNHLHFEVEVDGLPVDPMIYLIIPTP